jgi:tRNA(Ile)-lysidine synthase
MKGSRLVSDYLTDRKVSLFEKRRQLVITDALGDIVWLIGHRTDDRFKVTSDTATILRIEVHAKP